MVLLINKIVHAYVWGDHVPFVGYEVNDVSCINPDLDSPVTTGLHQNISGAS